MMKKENDSAICITAPSMDSDSDLELSSDEEGYRDYDASYSEPSYVEYNNGKIAKFFNTKTNELADGFTTSGVKSFRRIGSLEAKA